jgi:ABC-type antimicrobial peptide transport system permease subunit
VRLLAVGGAVGLVAGIVVARALHAEVGGLAPIDLTDVLPAAAVLALVVMAAAWMPARRATSIEPASALKQS